MSSSVFISYSRTDAKVVERITGVLSEIGIKYFLDRKDIRWGDPVSSQVQTALHNAIAILVVISPGSLTSQWVPYEIGHASALKKKILPYLTHPNLEVPSYIRDLNYASTLQQVKDYFTTAFDPTSDHSTARGPLQRSIDQLKTTSISPTLRDALTGEWKGEAHQQAGPEAAIQSVTVCLAQGSR